MSRDHMRSIAACIVMLVSACMTPAEQYQRCSDCGVVLVSAGIVVGDMADG